MKEKVFRWINTALMLDLFFVLACFGWFAIAVIGRATDIPLGLDIWYSLWNPVVQPAIGILMAGALTSGLISWISKRFQPGSMNKL